MGSIEHPYVFSVLSEDDVNDLVKLFGIVFSERDPPAVAMGIEPSEFETLVGLICKQNVGEGLSIVARSAQAGEICGALLTEDSTSPLPDGMETLSSKFDPIFDILGQLDAEYRSNTEVNTGESLHLFLLGVDRNYTGQGLAKQLIAHCIANGVQRGYRMAVTEATNRISQHVFRTQGFVEQVKRSYKDHSFNDRSFFDSITDEGGPILMNKRIGPLT